MAAHRIDTDALIPGGISPERLERFAVHASTQQGRPRPHASPALSIGYAVFLLDPEATVLDVNDKAEAYLDANRVFQLCPKWTLQLKDAGATSRMRTAIDRLTTSSGARLDDRPETFLLEDEPSASRVGVVVMAARRPLEAAGVPWHARVAAILLARDTGVSDAARRQVLVGAYGLTSREADVVAALLATGALSAAAKHLAITLSTAQTHLKSVFPKCGVKSQVALAVKVNKDFPMLQW